MRIALARPRVSALAVAVGSALALAGTAPAGAADYFVTSLDDNADTPSTLRGAICAANQTADADVIHLPSGTYVLSIAGDEEDLCQTGDLDVYGFLAIIGTGADGTRIDASRLDRVLDLHGSVETVALTLQDLSVVGGLAEEQSDFSGGGGIHATGVFQIYLGGVEVSDNLALDTSDAAGISVDGADGSLLLIENSAIVGNTSETGYGGGIRVEGDVDLAMRNSTIAGNSTDPGFGTGGGMYIDVGVNGSASIINSTISGNSAHYAAGAYLGAPVLIESSVIAGNTWFATNFINGDLAWNDGVGDAPSGTNNVIGAISADNMDPAPFVDGVDGNRIGTETVPLDPGLLALDEYGGETRTMALAGNSPARDNGINTDDLAFDQRGEGFPRVVGPSADSGAFELGLEIFADGLESPPGG